jgi:hypothetical protein
LDYFGNRSDSLDNGWGRTLNNSVESVDWVGSVGNGTDGTIGLNKRVLSLDDISVTGLMGRLGVSGEGVRDRVSVVVLWVGVEWFGGNGDGLSDNWGSVLLNKRLGISDLLDWLSIGDWSMSNSNWSNGLSDRLGVRYLWGNSVLRSMGILDWRGIGNWSCSLQYGGCGVCTIGWACSESWSQTSGSSAHKGQESSDLDHFASCNSVFLVDHTH